MCDYIESLRRRNSYEVSNHNEPTFWNRSEYYCLRAIRKLAEKPCIILGRCASDILKDRMNVLNIFVCADKEDRILRIMQKDHLDHDSAREKVEKTDEERAAYYYEHTGKTWGDVNDYHMILDTSELGVENCADILMHYFEKLEYI